jgi:hypothetical protein
MPPKSRSSPSCERPTRRCAPSWRRSRWPTRPWRPGGRSWSAGSARTPPPLGRRRRTGCASPPGTDGASRADAGRASSRAPPAPIWPGSPTPTRSWSTPLRAAGAAVGCLPGSRTRLFFKIRSWRFWVTSSSSPPPGRSATSSVSGTCCSPSGWSGHCTASAAHAWPHPGRADPSRRDCQPGLPRPSACPHGPGQLPRTGPAHRLATPHRPWPILHLTVATGSRRPAS